jgi:spore coat polysaccharide biosynthesis protein SpsF
LSQVVAIIQARLLSTRLPEKVMADISGMTLLEHVIQRAKAIPTVGEVVVATSDSPRDAAVSDLAQKAGAQTFAGSEDDVLDRFYRAATAYGATTIVRLTADCPLLDPQLSGAVLDRFRAETLDYVSNIHPPTFPDGLDTEVISFEALKRTWRDASNSTEREHVTSHIWENPDKFRIGAIVHSTDLSAMRWTVDEPEDLAFIRAISEHLAPYSDNCDYGFQRVLDILDLYPGLAEVNAAYSRNEGYTKSLKQDSTA